jgi:hypothetical protein
MTNLMTTIRTLLPLSRLLTVGLALGFAACGGESAAPSSAAAVEPAKASVSSSTASCLARAVEAPCDVLTEVVIRTAMPQVTQALTRSADNIGGPSCNYAWTAGRQTTIQAGQLTMDVPVDDSIRLSSVRRLEGHDSPAAFFARAHRTPDAAQKAHAIKAANAELDKKVAAGEIGGAHETLGKDFAANLVNKISWEAVDSLGDAAAWGGVGRFKTLDVLVGDVQFSLLADASNEDAGRRDASVAVARALIEQCD